MGVAMQVAVRERTAVGELDAPRAATRAASLTRFHQRIAAEALTAKSGVGASRLAPALAQSAVDLNPHQIEAAAFALSSMATGGCVLADEVGLGKTIEAGLVLAQLAAEGRGRILILVPASLRNQWRDELSGKFGLESSVVDGVSARAAEKHGLKVNPFDTGGIVIASHAFAALRWDEVARVPWDLAVIDEAHRLRNAYRRDHKTGQALRKALRKCPKLLLTATPLQNDVMELLGLTSFIDDALLGTEDTFRLQFASGELTEDKAADLQERLGHVVIRTLRRQVKEYVKFTARRSLVEDFAPTAEEQELYDRVSEYLRREDAVAIPQSRRALLVLVYRKILASSTFALSHTLTKLADSLEGKLAGAECAAGADAFVDLSGFEEEAEEWSGSGKDDGKPRGAAAVNRMRDELSELRACAKLAASIRVNAKGDALERGLDRAFTVARACGWPQKAVVFTEFRRTQDYLKKILEARGYTTTSLSGDSGDADKRQALVEEFRNRTADPAHDRGGRRGPEPPVLQPRGELRPALEPAARRAAHRPLPSLRAAARRPRPQLPQPAERRRRPPVRPPLAEAGALRRRLRLVGRDPGRARERHRLRGTRPRHLPVVPLGRGDRRRLQRAPQGPGRTASRPGSPPRARSCSRSSTARCAASSASPRRSPARRWRSARPTRRPSCGACSRRASRRPLPEPPPGEARSKARRARLAKAAAEAVKTRPQEAVALLEVDARALPAQLQELAGCEGWWFAYKFGFDALACEERVAHVILWADGDRYRALPADATEAFAALPAREAKGGPRGGAIPMGTAQEDALAALSSRLLGDFAERSGASYDEQRERWDRSVEDGLIAQRRLADDAREAWSRARAALHDKSELPLRDRAGAPGACGARVPAPARRPASHRGAALWREGPGARRAEEEGGDAGAAEPGGHGLLAVRVGRLVQPLTLPSSPEGRGSRGIVRIERSASPSPSLLGEESGRVRGIVRIERPVSLAPRSGERAGERGRTHLPRVRGGGLQQEVDRDVDPARTGPREARAGDDAHDAAGEAVVLDRVRRHADALAGGEVHLRHQRAVEAGVLPERLLVAALQVGAVASSACRASRPPAP